MQQPWSAMSKKKREYDFVAKSLKQCRVSLYGQTFCDEYAHGRPFVEMLNQGVCFVVCSTSCCADMSIKHGGINRSAHMRLIEVVFFKLLNYSETVWSSEDRHLQTKKHIARKTIEMDIKKKTAVAKTFFRPPPTTTTLFQTDVTNAETSYVFSET